MTFYAIGGFPLENRAQGFRLLSATQYATGVTMRRSSTSVPRMHGELPDYRDPLGAAQLILNVRIDNPEPELLETRRLFLMSLLGVGRNRAITVSRTVGTRTQVAQAQLVGVAPVEGDNYSCPGGYMKLLITLNIPSGLWRDEEFQSYGLALTSPVQDIPLFSQSTGPVTDARVRVLGPLSGITVTDQESGTSLSWASSTPITGSQYLLIDCGDFTAWRNTSSDWASRQTSETASLRVLGTGMFAPISVPSLTGANTSTIQISATGTTGSSAAFVRGRRAYT